MNTRDWFWGALILALGMSVAGWFIGSGFSAGRSANRYVTVKGVAERDVHADIALWPIRFVSTDDDLKKAQQKTMQSQSAVMHFLQKQGIDRAEAEIQKLEVTDLLANPYRTGELRSRYIITQTIMVRSTQPDLIRKASQKVGDLVEAGVILSGTGGPDHGQTYLFSGLNEIKPEMIAEATANARHAAEQFAKDSGSRINGIRRANQGVFVILPRDRAREVTESGQYYKTVRVVSTIEYNLQD